MVHHGIPWSKCGIPKNPHQHPNFVEFLRGGCSTEAGNWGTLREDWGILGNIGED